MSCHIKMRGLCCRYLVVPLSVRDTIMLFHSRALFCKRTYTVGSNVLYTLLHAFACLRSRFRRANGDLPPSLTDHIKAGFGLLIDPQFYANALSLSGSVVYMISNAIQIAQITYPLTPQDDVTALSSFVQQFGGGCVLSFGFCLSSRLICADFGFGNR